MECYGGDGVARRELVHSYGDGRATGARRLLLALRQGGRPRKNEMGSTGGSGRVRGVLKPCSGLAEPHATRRR